MCCGNFFLKAARQSVAQDNLNSDQKQILSFAEEDQEKIQSYEDAFRIIKEATGVSDTQVCAVTDTLT